MRAEIVPKCPRKCPIVPILGRTGRGTAGQDSNSNKNQPTELTLGMVNYSLQKYKGTATRHTCPNCGDRHSFAYYVDDSGVPLHPSVGRCNHESSCGYHYTPKEYFHDRPECRTAKEFSFDKNKTERKTGQASRQTVTGYISPRGMWKGHKACIVTSSASFPLSLALIMAARQREVLRRLLEDYRLGATRDGAVIFWQIDRENKGTYRQGDAVQSRGTDTVSREGEALAVDWIHSKLKRQRVLPEEWQLSQCLFGEHLLNVYPDKGSCLGGIREKCSYRLCHISRLCMAGGRRQESDERGKTPCAGRTNRTPSFPMPMLMPNGSSVPSA